MKNPMKRFPRIRVYASRDIRKLEKLCIEKTGENLDTSGEYDGFAQTFAKGSKVKSFVYISESADDFTIIIHEASHVADSYLNAIEERECGTEFRAYLTESVADCIRSQIEG